MRRYLRDRLPDHHSLLAQGWLGPIRHWLVHPNLWHLHRRSVAGGVAVGLFCGLIPGPLQMISAALMSILFRVNLPVAVLTTLYTNPFTIVPLYLLAYEIGVLVTGQDLHAVLPPFPELTWQEGLLQIWNWLLALGKPLLIGLPLLAIGLAIMGYVVVRLVWRIYLMHKWRTRNRK